jgi:ketosteroid isomerase-like protein
MSFIRIGTYQCGLDGADEVVRRAEQTLVPSYRKRPGFLSYVLGTTPGDQVLSFSLWQTLEQAMASKGVAERWVQDSARGLVLSGESLVGEVGVMTSVAEVGELLVRRLYACFNEGTLDNAREVVAPGARMRTLAFDSDEPLLASLQDWMIAFPDAKIDVQRMIATEDLVVAEFIGRGTHLGPLNTPDGPIEPTGRTVEIFFVDSFDIRDGQIAGGRTYFDTGRMLGQLGLVMQPSVTVPATQEAPSPPTMH